MTLRLWVAFALTAFAIMFGGHAARLIPGGPFISITGDILPCVAAVVAVGFAVGCWRGKMLWPKVASFLLSFLSVFAIKNVFVSVYSFWTAQSARGELFGW